MEKKVHISINVLKKLLKWLGWKIEKTVDKLCIYANLNRIGMVLRE